MSAPAPRVRFTLAVLSQAGKKVVLLVGAGGLAMSDLISSHFWGRRVKPAGIPFLLEVEKIPSALRLPGGLGCRRRGAALFCELPALSGERLPRSRAANNNRGLDWPWSPIFRSRALLRQGRGRKSAASGVREGGGNLAAERRALSDAADDLPQRPGLAERS